MTFEITYKQLWPFQCEGQVQNVQKNIRYLKAKFQDRMFVHQMDTKSNRWGILTLQLFN